VSGGKSARHTDDEIADAARRFRDWADRLDPDQAQVEDVSDLRAVAEAADAVRRDEARLTENVARSRARGRSWNLIAAILGVSRQAARQRYGRFSR
jgi:hypothetical protein